jgi:hypothetical protein
MSQEFDISAGVAAAVEGRAGVWQFIQEFARLWRSLLASGDGYSEADISAAQQRLGVRFPAAVAEAYQLFGRRRDLTSNMDRLFRPGELSLAGNGHLLVFRQECQGCARWGVPLHLPGDPDPPVIVEAAEASLGQGWAPYLDRFSLACLEMVLSESLFTGAGLHDSTQLDDDGIKSLEQNFTRLAIPSYPLWTGPPVVRWFAGPDVILRADADTWLWARARATSALDKVRAAIPGDWSSAPQTADP